MGNETKDWKLKLRYGKIKTNFCHFTVMADGVAAELVEGFECRPGRAWIAMKTWASDVDEAADMIRAIGSQIGFTVEGRIYVYDTEPELPPIEKPYGYDISFTSYDEDA